MPNEGKQDKQSSIINMEARNTIYAGAWPVTGRRLKLNKDGGFDPQDLEGMGGKTVFTKPLEMRNSDGKPFGGK